MAGATNRTGRFAGDYQWTRMMYSDYNDIKNINTFKMSATDSGTILFMNKQFERASVRAYLLYNGSAS